MSWRSVVLGLVPIGVSLAACGTSPAAPAPGTLSGVVTIGPACPGPSRADRPCPPKPFEAEIRIVPKSGGAAKSIRSDAEGRFRLQLPAGDYRLEPVDGTPAGVPSSPIQEVSIASGKTTEVRIRYESGIR